MSKNMIKFINVGLYKTQEEAKEIAEILLMSKCFTPIEYAEVVMAIEKYFNPAPPVVENPVDDTNEK